MPVRGTLRLKLVAFFLAISASTLVSADSLWQLVDSAPYHNTLVNLSLPNGAGSPQAILLDGEALQAMAATDIVDLDISASISHQYQLDGRRRFANGDSGWGGGLIDSPEQYTLSLTRSGDLLLGSFFSPTGKYKILLRRLPGPSASFVGWLYSNPQNFEVMPYEGGGDSFADSNSGSDSDNDDPFARFGSGSARLQINDGDVTVVQTLPATNVVIGESFQFSVEITNDTAEEIRNKFLVVGGVLNTATYLDGPEYCEAETINYTSGPAQELFCLLDSVAPDAKKKMTFTVVANEESYPALPSVVVIDDLIDQEFIFVSHDTLLDSDSDSISDFNELILSTDPNNSASSVPATDKVDIDVMFLYTQKFADDVEHGSPETEINLFLQETNYMFASSGAGLRYNPVYYGLTSHVVDGDIGASWEMLRQGEGQDFQDVDFLRISQGADLVVLVDGDYVLDVEGSCGIANLAGAHSQGDLSHFWWQRSGIFTAIYRPDSYNPDTGRGCDETLLAHEFGHLMGLSHSRIEENGTGTFSWARGHGVDDKFNTIMAYTAHFPGSTTVPRFSSPASFDCDGLACGVSKDDVEQGADSVLALNTTRFAVANYMQTRPSLFVSDASGIVSGATMFGGAAITNDDAEPDYLFKNNFKPDDAFSLVGSINVADEHVGEMGVTHIVILLDNTTFFQVNTDGSYVPWDGDLANLTGNIEPRPLQRSEHLVAFRDLVAEQEGVSEADLTVYYAYQLLDSDVLVYSTEGASLIIRP